MYGTLRVDQSKRLLGAVWLAGGVYYTFLRSELPAGWTVSFEHEASVHEASHNKLVVFIDSTFPEKSHVAYSYKLGASESSTELRERYEDLYRSQFLKNGVTLPAFAEAMIRAGLCRKRLSITESQFANAKRGWATALEDSDLLMKASAYY